jgi:hypothetical protein
MMSLKQMILAFTTEVGNPIRKLILLKLADCANDEGVCWPSHDTIAKHAECSRKSVIRHMKVLEDSGMISTSNQYRSNLQETNIYQLKLRCDNESTAGTLSPVAGTMCPEVRTESHTEPIKEPVIEPVSPVKAKPTKKLTKLQEHEEAATSAEIPENLNHPTFYQQWGEFCYSRGSNKQYLTKVAVKAIIRKFEGFTVDEVCNALADSVISGWAGVFPKKAGSGYQAKPKQQMTSMPTEDVYRSQSNAYDENGKLKF